MTVFLSSVAWHLKGTCTWSISIVNFILCLTLALVELCRSQSYSKTTLSTVLIAISGIGSSVMAQAAFIREEISVRTAPDWVMSLNSFTTSNYCAFLEHLFAPMTDLLIICDGMCFYVIICWPDKKDSILCKKAVGLYLFLVGLISAIIASLATKNHHDRYQLLFDNPWSTDGHGFELRHAWIADIILKIAVSILSCAMYVVFTLGIRVSLQKSIAFLNQSNASAHAVDAYQRIIKFTTIIRAIFVTFNIGVHILEIWVYLHEKLLLHHPAALGFDYITNVTIMRMMPILAQVTKVLMCGKTTCYTSVYIWMRYNCNKQRK